MVTKHQLSCQYTNFASVAPVSGRSTIAPAGEDQKANEADTTKKKADEEADIKEIKVEIVPDEEIRKDVQHEGTTNRAPDVEPAEEDSKEDKRVQDVLEKAKEKSKNSFAAMNSDVGNANKNEDLGLEVANYYCVTCKLVQSFRCKHCKVCDKCVATFDHHCLWMGNCIGEKNKRAFFIYIVFQFIHCVWALVTAFRSFKAEKSANDWILWNWALLAAIGVDVYFTAFLLILISFHTFLCLNNLTTCNSNLKK